MKIFIDGDGCPVKNETLTVAKHFLIPVVLVTSFDHYSTKNEAEDFTTVYVDWGVDSADYKIVALTAPGDVAITQDYGLASLLLGQGVQVLHQNFVYQKETIDFLLQTRYLGQQQRKNHQRQKGPAPFTKEDRVAFKQMLTAVLQVEK